MNAIAYLHGVWDSNIIFLPKEDIMRGRQQTKMSDRENEIHNEANRIAEIIFYQFYEEFKNTNLKTLNAHEAMSMAADSIAIIASQAIGTIYTIFKNDLSGFVTSNIIIETVNRAFKQNFECFIKLQEQVQNDKTGTKTV